MDVQNFDFYKTVNILADFADWDTTERLNHSLRAWCDYDDSEFLPYETLLGKTMNILSGISSSLSYMHLSISQIRRGTPDEYLERDGFQEYDLYRYHYIVFSHSLASLQDLLFKLTAIIFHLNVPNRMIGWEKLDKELKRNNLNDIKSVFEKFYVRFSEHINKRNRFSHEGLLCYKTLDNFYMTIVWTGINNMNLGTNNRFIQFKKGSDENTVLLEKTKDKFISELSQLSFDAEKFTQDLFNLCSEKLLSQVDSAFLKKHKENILSCNHEYLNNYLDEI